MYHRLCRELEPVIALHTLANRAVEIAREIAKQASESEAVQLDKVDNTTLLVVQFLREMNIRISAIHSDDPTLIGKHILDIPIQRTRRDLPAIVHEIKVA